MRSMQNVASRGKGRIWSLRCWLGDASSFVSALATAPLECRAEGIATRMSREPPPFDWNAPAPAPAPLPVVPVQEQGGPNPQAPEEFQLAPPPLPPPPRNVMPISALPMPVEPLAYTYDVGRRRPGIITAIGIISIILAAFSGLASLWSIFFSFGMYMVSQMEV